MTAPKPLIHLCPTMAGRWFAACHWCHASTPTVAARDDLALLAAAKAAGWRVTERSDWHTRFWLACPRCVRRGRQP